MVGFVTLPLQRGTLLFSYLLIREGQSAAASLKWFVPEGQMKSYPPNLPPCSLLAAIDVPELWSEEGLHASVN